MIKSLSKETKIGIVLLAVAILFNAIFLFSEVKFHTPFLNDEILHYTAIQEASSALKEGRNPTDFWLSEIGLGYPLFHYYQHLPHLVIANINQITSHFISLNNLLDFSRYFLLVLFPLSIFLAMIRFGFNPLAAGLSALVSSLLSTNGIFGWEYGSYIWQGFGLYTQLWAMFFLPLALAEIYRTIRKEGSWFWPVFLSTVVLLSHVIYGYILFLSAITFVFLKIDKKEIFSRLKRLIFIFFLIIITSSYFLLPFFLDGEYFNKTIWFESSKYDSFGYIWILRNLLVGNLLDYGRFLSLTILFFLGAILLIFKFYEEEKYRLPLLLTIFWLLLFFGRPTWGALFNILPFSRDLQIIRFSAGFHLGVILTIGAGLAILWQLIQKRFPQFTFLALIIFLTFLLPVYLERAHYFNQNSEWKIENQKAFSQVKNELSEIEKTIKELPPGRVYAGLVQNFGDYPYYKIGFVPFYSLFPQWGIDSFGFAYHALALSDDVRLHFDETKPAQYDLFNIRYVLLHKTWTPAYYYNKIKEFDNYVLYEVPTTGYFDLVDAPAVFYGDKYDFYSPNSKWLFSSLPESKQYPILILGDKPKDIIATPFKEVDDKLLAELIKTPPSSGEILKEEVKNNEYSAQFEVSQSSYLVLKVNYDPGWQVFLDNQKVSPVMLTPGFIGIKVEPGIHRAVFLYKAPVFRIPLFILGLIILFGLATYNRFYKYFKTKYNKHNKVEIKSKHQRLLNNL